MFDENMSSFETPQNVRQWCTKLGLNPRKVAAVGPMVPRVTEEFIYQVLDGEQTFYHPRVAASRRDSAGVLLNILIESPREIDHELTTQGEALTTQYAVKAHERVPLNKTLFDSPAEKSQIKRCPSCESMVSKGSRHSSGGRLDTPEIVSALGQLTDQKTQLAWNGNFKRLKVFSGTDPVPTGEESFESWRDSTVLSVRDWTGPETTMRRKILESLRSPAVDVVKSYVVGHPDATSGDLIEVLEVTFGPVEKQGLILLVSRGAITDGEMDSLKIRLLKRGTLNSDPVAMTIRAHNQDKLPPGYVALMERVRREETDAYVRVKRSSTSGHTEKSPADAKLLEENKKLRKELEELKAQLSERAKPPAEAKKVPKCYRCGKLCHIQPNFPVPDEGETQSVLCKARSCKTYKNITVQKSYYEPSICESDSPGEEKVLSREKTTVENPVGMKACQGIRQARSFPVCPRGECRGHEESFPCMSACDIIQPSCMLDSDPIGWEPQCILGRKVLPRWRPCAIIPSSQYFSYAKGTQGPWIGKGKLLYKETVTK
ncbi:hypothetical protein XELAEV_18000582mg [Xenopus laevis]|nr:hypothetical protein XELAEV_18000582mg [Xenopus laevis]